MSRCPAALSDSPRPATVARFRSLWRSTWLVRGLRSSGGVACVGRLTLGFLHGMFVVVNFWRPD